MGDAQKLLDLASDWRHKAGILREYGAATPAAALETCAIELKDAIRAWQQEPLTLEQAVEETGYTYSSLQQKVAAGDIPNVGTNSPW